MTEIVIAWGLIDIEGPSQTYQMLIDDAVIHLHRAEHLCVTASRLPFIDPALMLLLLDPN